MAFRAVSWAHPTVPMIKSHAVARLQPLPRLRQIGFAGLNDQMIMVIHHHLALNQPVEPRGCLRQQSEPAPTVHIILVNHASFGAARGDVIPRSGPFDPQWSCHARLLASIPSLDQPIC